MGTCPGSCASCAGCGRELELTEKEIEFLNTLGQIPFLPVARKLGEDSPVFLEWGDRLEMSLVLQCLEKKGLISLDYDQPIKGLDMSAYGAYPVQGSLSLTARGQQVLELMEYQGIRESL